MGGWVGGCGSQCVCGGGVVCVCVCRWVCVVSVSVHSFLPPRASRSRNIGM